MKWVTGKERGRKGLESSIWTFESVYHERRLYSFIQSTNTILLKCNNVDEYGKSLCQMITIYESPNRGMKEGEMRKTFNWTGLNLSKTERFFSQSEHITTALQPVSKQCSNWNSDQSGILTTMNNNPSAAEAKTEAQAEATARHRYSSPLRHWAVLPRTSTWS